MKRAITSLIGAIVCSLAIDNGGAQAQTFTVPGNTRGWFNTRIDVGPGTLIRISASGTVDVGAGWGVHGPEGTTRFADVPGYPAATRYRYGLVARLTESRTNGYDELHNDYAYGEIREFCSGGSGHLWLAVNDDRPENNTGGYTVTITRSTCAATPAGTPGPLHATFTVVFQGFTVHRQTWDDALNSDGRGDEVYFTNNVLMTDVTGTPATPLFTNWGGFTSTFGDTGAGNIVRAGNATPNGGLETGNSFPATNPELGGSGRFGGALFFGELTAGRTGAVIVHSVFESDRREDIRRSYFNGMNEVRASLLSNLTTLIRGSALRTPAEFLRSGDSMGLGLLRSRITHGTSLTGESADRPIGMVRRLGGNGFTFVPQVLVLTYESADAISRGDLFGKGRGIVEIRHTDPDTLKGDYSLFYRVQRASS